LYHVRASAAEPLLLLGFALRPRNGAGRAQSAALKTPQWVLLVRWRDGHAQLGVIMICAALANSFIEDSAREPQDA